jgi:DNA polymerase III subunit delta'
MTDFIAIDINDLGLEADRFGEVPHPRETLFLTGHQEQEQDLLAAFRTGKLHHALLFTGAEGIGKATLAYRFARFLLANPDPATTHVQNAKDLFVPASNSVAGQVARLSHPDLGIIRRGLTKDGKNLRTEISVDSVRDALGIFRKTAGAGGWRIIIVDCADDLNRSSANALLKMLEEPPERAVFMLIAQRPGALLPTIRSRCRVLRFKPLTEAEVVEGLAKLSEQELKNQRDVAVASEGSLRKALALIDPESASFRRDARKILDQLTTSNAKAIRGLIEKTTGRAGEKAFVVLLDMIESHLHTGVRTQIMGTMHKSVLAAKAELWEKLRKTARDIETYNLDRRPFLLSLFSELAEIERRAAQ